MRDQAGQTQRSSSETSRSTPSPAHSDFERQRAAAHRETNRPPLGRRLLRRVPRSPQPAHSSLLTHRTDSPKLSVEARISTIPLSYTWHHVKSENSTSSRSN
ncbi:hypothetical protein PsYK624_054350 [Phanerochaete sordida]|uniref:Uncharacterized protein n=1 Tax=Phanerochaete sordida TaxID=48140 RepID=A0A9P3LBC3_9APHY|nr:hypothetical protein PsYK624_054350 [Phanerochaete sordida]